MRQFLLIVAATWMGSAWACADLSGNWKGNCQVQGTTESSTSETKIEQTACAAISLDGAALTIGQTKTETHTEQGVTENSELLPEWNADQSSLIVSEKLTGTEQSSARMLYEVTSKNSYSIIGQKLVSELAETARDLSSNPPQVNTRTVRCEFTKQ